MPSQLDRLEALLAEQEASVREAFEEFIRTVNSERVWQAIADRLELGDINGALDIVDSYVVRFADIVPTIHQAVGAATAAELATTASEFIIAISFDPSHPRAAQLARVNRMNLIREFTAEQRRATRQAIAESFDAGTGTFQTARAFRGSIGLNSTQQAWVSNFERGLRTLDRRVLDRALRDRRFDRTLERAIRDSKPLTEAQIQAQVDRYRARALMMRSETIARSEALRATSQAREESLQQMIEQTNIDRSRIRRIWNATRDERVRDWHLSMNGQERLIGVKFEDGNGDELMYPGDPDAPGRTTINCRCTTTFRVLPVEQLARA